jgi:RHS repeat-associated protein
LVYDAAGQLAFALDPLGRVTRYDYDDLGLAWRTTLPDPDGPAGPQTAPVTTAVFDAAGQLQSVTDPLGATTRFGYDALGRQTAVTLPDPGTGDHPAATAAYVYNADGTLYQSFAPGEQHQRVTSYQYDSLGRPTAVYLPDPLNGTPTGPVTRQVYDDAGDLWREIDALGNVTEHQYDLRHRLTLTTLPDPDAAGPLPAPQTAYVYDAADRLVEVRVGYVGLPAAEWRVTSYAYDRLGQQTAVTLPDPDGPGEANPLVSPVYQTAYDALGNVVAQTDPLGVVTRYEYDRLGRQTAVIANYTGDGVPRWHLPDQNVTVRTAYTADGLVASQTQIVPVRGDVDFDGDVDARDIDLMQDEVAAYWTDPTRPFNAAFDLDRNGHTDGADLAVLVRNVLGTEFGDADLDGDVDDYDSTVVQQNFGRPIHPGDPPVGWADGDLDGSGHVDGNDFSIAQAYFGFRGTRRYPSALRTTSFVYDALGRVVQTTLPDPDGAGPQVAPVSHATYDALGNVLTTTDPLGNVTSFSYDTLGRLISETDAVQMTKPAEQRLATVYHYNLLGLLSSVTDPDDNTTMWTYDLLGRTTTETNPLGYARRFEYDAAGQLTRRTDRNGRVMDYVYDHLGRLTDEEWRTAEGQMVGGYEWAYDAFGQLARVDDSVSQWSEEYVYDRLGRTTLTTTRQNAPWDVSRRADAYNAAGRRTQSAMSLQEQPVGLYVNDYVFDQLGRMQSLQQQAGSSSVPVADKRVDFSYNAAGQFDRIARFADLAATKLVATGSYFYDNAGRLTSLGYAKGATTLVAHSWSFDSAGRMTGYVNSIDGTTTYTNDATNQLVSADHAGQADENYQYDANGNRTNNGYQVGANNRMLSDGTYRYDYDAEGNRTLRYVWTDANANGQVEAGEQGQVTQYTWDHRNRLVSVSYFAGAIDYGCGEPTSTVSYAYDAYGRLISRSYDADGFASGSGELTHYLYDGMQIVAAETSGPAPASHGFHTYLYGPAVDQVLADDASPLPPGEGQGGSSVRWLLTDHLNTVRDIAVFSDQGTLSLTDDVTTIVNHRVFDSFGKLVSETNVAIAAAFGFAGRLYDPASQQTWNVTRWHDTLTGRWASEDTIGLSGGDPNFSRYCGNQPTIFVDPSGLQVPSGPGLDPRLQHLPPALGGFQDGSVRSLTRNIDPRVLEQLQQGGRDGNKLTPGVGIQLHNNVGAVPGQGIHEVSPQEGRCVDALLKEQEALRRSSEALRDYTLAGGALIGGVALAVLFPEVALGLGIIGLYVGIPTSVQNRSDRHQTLAQVIGGTIADVSGVQAVYGGWTNKDVASGEGLRWSDTQRRFALVGGAGQLAGWAGAARGLWNALRTPRPVSLVEPPIRPQGNGPKPNPPIKEPVIFNEVHNPANPGRFVTLRPGPFAQESIPLEGVGRPATAAQQRAINEIGNQYGCHTCGCPSPGTQSGNWVLDHQPPTAMTLPGQSQVGYPHCDHCSRIQGGEVRAWQQ